MQTNDKDIKFIRCPVCEAVNINTGGKIHCHRCGSLIFREPAYGLYVSWAFFISALILYIPANIFPVLEIRTVFSSSTNTIIGGVFRLWDDESYFVALVILVASVLVPILKFIVILYLLIGAKIGIRGDIASHHKLYYFTEIIGPWSMVDIFVVTILAGLVKYNDFKIVAGTGATAFVLMVFFAMMSAMTFDLRFIKKRNTQEGDPDGVSRDATDRER